MKILLVHDYGTATGGAELQMLNLRQGLRDRGHEVRLFSSSATLVESPLLADDHCFGTTTPIQGLSQTANFSAYWNLRRVLKNFQPDVVHVRMFMWQLSPLILPLLRNIPCLYQTAVYKAICPLGTRILPDGADCQDTAGIACLRNGCLTPQSWAVLMVQRQLWQQWRSAFDRVVALSSRMKVKLEAEGITPVEVIHNGVPARSMRPPLQDPPTIAFAGRIVAEKGVESLLQAFARVKTQIPQAQMLIAGQGSEVARLRSRCDELGVSDSVRWLGHLSRSRLEQEFDSAWVQAVPSLWDEPFGNVTTEAMMRGTAVVANAVGAQPEIVQQNVTGLLVPPNQVEALSEALLNVLQNRDLAERMGAAGHQRSQMYFSEDRRTERFLELYQQIRTKYDRQPA